MRDAEQDSTYDELVPATIGMGPYVAFGLGALSFAVLPDFWAVLAAGTAVASVIGGATAFHFLGKRERRVNGAEEWKTLIGKAHVLDAAQFVQRLFAHKSVLSPAMAKLLDMKAGDEDKILNEMGAADLVALGRLTSRVQRLPGGVPFEPAGESRELVSRVLECLWPDSAPLSFQSPKIGPVSL